MFVCQKKQENLVGFVAKIVGCAGAYEASDGAMYAFKYVGYGMQSVPESASQAHT